MAVQEADWAREGGGTQNFRCTPTGLAGAQHWIRRLNPLTPSCTQACSSSALDGAGLLVCLFQCSLRLHSGSTRTCASNFACWKTVPLQRVAVSLSTALVATSPDLVGPYPRGGSGSLTRGSSIHYQQNSGEMSSPIAYNGSLLRGNVPFSWVDPSSCLAVTRCGSNFLAIAVPATVRQFRIGL